MGLFRRPRSPYWWAELEGTGRPNIRFSTKIPIDGGTPHQTRRNRKLAEEAYAAAMGDTARKRFQLPSDQPPVTFARHAAWYEQHHTIHHRSVERERVILGHLRRHFGALPLNEITPARWQEYVTDRRKDGISLNTIGRELAVLKACLQTAIGDHLEHHPLASVKRKTEKPRAKRTLSVDDETRLLHELSDAGWAATRAPDRTPAADARERRARAEMRDLYLVGVGTLLRQLNLIELRKADHRGDRLVVSTKTGPHQIPLTGPTPLQERAADVLERRMPKRDDDYFFPEWQARFAKSRDAANKKFLVAFERACKRAGIPWGLPDGVVWHTATRASGATRMLRDYRIDVRTVQFIGNWSSLDQMSVYLGIDRDALFDPKKRR